jgi:hypothetical protein
MKTIELLPRRRWTQVDLTLSNCQFVPRANGPQHINNKIELLPPFSTGNVGLTLGLLQYATIPRSQAARVYGSDGVLNRSVEGLHRTFLVERILKCWTIEALAIEPNQLHIRKRHVRGGKRLNFN